VLNLLQIELMDRCGHASDQPGDGSGDLEDVLRSSVNGVAAAMQSTG